MRCRVALLLALLFAPAAQAQDFPYDRDLVLKARPMRGSKRVPILSVSPDGQAQIDLWCKRGTGQAVIAGETVTIEETQTDLTIHTDTGPHSVRRTTDQPVRRIKAHRPRKMASLWPRLIQHRPRWSSP